MFEVPKVGVALVVFLFVVSVACTTATSGNDCTAAGGTCSVGLSPGLRCAAPSPAACPGGPSPAGVSCCLSFEKVTSSSDAGDAGTPTRSPRDASDAKVVAMKPDGGCVGNNPCCCGPPGTGCFSAAFAAGCEDGQWTCPPDSTPLGLGGCATHCASEGGLDASGDAPRDGADGAG
jgi:hypothetical protein